MTEAVKEQLQAVRNSGLTNMLDLRAVQRIAYEMDYFDLVCFIYEHRREYIHFIFTGEAKDEATDGIAGDTKGDVTDNAADGPTCAAAGGSAQ